MFLVTGTVVERRYMREETSEKQESHFIHASSEAEAEVKFHCHYERLSCPYEVSYCVSDVHVVATIDIVLSQGEKEKYSWRLN